MKERTGLSMAQSSSKKHLTPKELQAIRDQKDEDRRNSPQERKRQMIIKVGATILISVFALTSLVTGLSCNSDSKRPGAGPAAKRTPVDPVTAELHRWQAEAKEKPGDATVLANWAFFLMQQSAQPNKLPTAGKIQLAEALDKVNDSLKAKPDYGFAVRLKGQILLLQDQADTAKQQFERALELSLVPVDKTDKEYEIKKNNALGDEIEARMGLVKVARKKSDLKSANKELDQIIKLSPGNLDAFMERVELDIDENQPERARKDMETVTKIAQNMAQQGVDPTPIIQRLIGLSQMLEAKFPSPKTPSSASPTPQENPSATSSVPPASSIPAPSSSPSSSPSP